MIISQIVAASLNNVIGVNRGLPWHMPTDMEYFRETTMGHHIVTGRRNYEAEGQALPGRNNIVLTRNRNYQLKDALVLHTVEEAISYAKKQGETELFIVGGEEIYRLAMPYTQRIYLTRIKTIIDGDTHYPEPDLSQWKRVKLIENKADELNPFDYDFIIYEK